MHLFNSLFYLALVIGLLFSYFLVGFGFYLLIRRLVRWNRLKKAGVEPQKNLSPLIIRRDLWIVSLFFVFLIIFNVQFYLRQRAEWMGADNANLTAKEYYVAGQVLDLYRSVLTRFIHPENWLVLPMTVLQERIYRVGSKYLPEDDGEIGIWMDTWLVYPYSKRFRLPKGYLSYTNDDKIAPMLVKFLDRAWFAIENVATKPIADRQMYEQHYLRNFAGMAHFYAYQKGGYAPGNSGSGFYLAKIPKHVRRSELLVKWLEDLKKRWKEFQNVQKFLYQNPEVEVMQQVALVMEFHDLILAKINDGNFICEDPYWITFREVRKEFTEGRNGETALKRMRNRGKAEQFNEVAIQSVIAKFDTYVLGVYCGIMLPGKIDWSFERRTSSKKFTLKEALENSLDGLYQNEFIKLEDQFNGNK